MKTKTIVRTMITMLVAGVGVAAVVICKPRIRFPQLLR